MDALLRELPPGALVLDLAAGNGSFAPERYPWLRIVRLDIAQPARSAGAAAVQADAAALPFRDGTFQAVICNHGLEHFVRLEATVAEMGRVLQPGGGLFLSVPDATTLTDRLYRFLARGGGHVNRFRSPEQVVSLVERVAGLRCRGQRTLYTSLCFLHPCNRGRRRNRRLWLLLGAPAGALRWAVWLFRIIDRRLGTRLAVYGWSFYFGSIAPQMEETPWLNVCIRCGAGHPAASLNPSGPRWAPSYRCPECGERNRYVAEGG